MDNTLVKIEGRYLKTLYRNEGNMKTKFLFRITKCERKVEEKLRGTKTILCEGESQKYGEGFPLILMGKFKNDAYGNILFQNEFPVLLITSLEPDINNRNSLKQYILFCLPHGMGIAAADKITELITASEKGLQEFLTKEPEEELARLDIFKNEPGKLNLFLKKAQEKLIVHEIIKELLPYGVTIKEIMDIYEKHGQKSILKLKEDPYSVLAESRGSFFIADTYARDNHVLFYDDIRIRGLINLCFRNIEESGNAYVSYSEFIRFIRAIQKRLLPWQKQT